MKRVFWCLLTLSACVSAPAHAADVVSPQSFSNPYFADAQARQPMALTPELIMSRLPTMRLYKMPHGRDVLIVSHRCPVEVLSGTKIAPAEMFRAVLDNVFMQLNEQERLPFDVQIVCS